MLNVVFRGPGSPERSCQHSVCRISPAAAAAQEVSLLLSPWEKLFVMVVTFLPVPPTLIKNNIQRSVKISPSVVLICVRTASVCVV